MKAMAMEVAFLISMTLTLATAKFSVTEVAFQAVVLQTRLGCLPFETIQFKTTVPREVEACGITIVH